MDLHSADTTDTKNFLRVDSADVQLLAELDMFAILNKEGCALEHRVGNRLVTVVRGQDELAAAIRVLDRDLTCGLGDRGRTLRGTGLEQLGDAGKALGDVVSGCHTTGVEGTHRQLRARLTDRLGGDDTDSLTGVDELAGRERTAVAGRTNSDGGLTGEHRTNLGQRDTGRHELLDQNISDIVARLGNDLALGVDRVLGKAAGVKRVLDVSVANQHTIGIRRRDRQVETTRGATVVLADDDILRDVHKTPREVAGVSRTQSRVGQTLTSTVGCDEVLGNRKPLAVARDDRARNDLTLRVRHEPSHTGNLANLHPVTASTRADHAVDVVVLRHVLFHRLGDFSGCLVPDLDELLATLGVGS